MSFIIRNYDARDGVSLFDGRGDDEHNSTNFVEIPEVFITQNAFFNNAIWQFTILLLPNMISLSMLLDPELACTVLHHKLAQG